MAAIYQLELKRYRNALERLAAQRRSAEQQAAEQQRQLEAQRQQQQREANEQWRQYYAAIEQQTQQFEAKCQVSRIEAGKRYPQFADPDSELTKKVFGNPEATHRKTQPDHGSFGLP